MRTVCRAVTLLLRPLTPLSAAEVGLAHALLRTQYTTAEPIELAFPGS